MNSKTNYQKDEILRNTKFLSSLSKKNLSLAFSVGLVPFLGSFILAGIFMLIVYSLNLKAAMPVACIPALLYFIFVKRAVEIQSKRLYGQTVTIEFNDIFGLLFKAMLISILPTLIFVIIFLLIDFQSGTALIILLVLWGLFIILFHGWAATVIIYTKITARFTKPRPLESGLNI